MKKVAVLAMTVLLAIALTQSVAFACSEDKGDYGKTSEDVSP